MCSYRIVCFCTILWLHDVLFAYQANSPIRGDNIFSLTAFSVSQLLHFTWDWRNDERSTRDTAREEHADVDVLQGATEGQKKDWSLMYTGNLATFYIITYAPYTGETLRRNIEIEFK